MGKTYFHLSTRLKIGISTSKNFEDSKTLSRRLYRIFETFFCLPSTKQCWLSTVLAAFDFRLSPTVLLLQIVLARSNGGINSPSFLISRKEWTDKGNFLGSQHDLVNNVGLCVCVCGNRAYLARTM